MQSADGFLQESAIKQTLGCVNGNIKPCNESDQSPYSIQAKAQLKLTKPKGSGGESVETQELT